MSQQQQQQQQQTAIVPVPPDPPVPLPDAIRERVLQALSGSGTSVPRIQRALAAELEPDAEHVAGSASFGSQVYEMIVQQLRERRAVAAGDDAQGQLTLRSISRGQAGADKEEALIRSQVMAAVKAAREQDPESQLRLTPETRKAMLQAVRHEVSAVCRVEEHEGVDTPFGKMF